MKKFIKENLSYISILTLLVIGVYANTFDNAFVSDDKATFLEDQSINNFSYILRAFAFTRAFLYWVTFQLFGPTPFQFRFINYAFHLGNVFLIFIIVNRLSSKKVAFISSLLFAVHPLLTESVTWISGGPYSQGTFFLLLSFYLYVAGSGKKYLFSIISFFLALQSQTVTSVLPAILLTYEITFSSLKKNWVRIIPFALLTVIWFAQTMIFAVPERSQTLQTTHYQEKGIVNPLLSLPIMISSYLQLIFWPKDLTLYHSELSFSPLTFTLNLLVTIGFFTLIVFSFLKRREVFFWLSLFLIALTPTMVTSTFKLTWIVAERYAYLAALGIFVAFATVLEKPLNNKKFKSLTIVFLVGIILALSFRSIVRNNDWQNEDSLWIATGKSSPSSPNTHNNLGDMYGRWGDKQKAIAEFQEAIRIKPDYADAYHNLANTYKEIGNTDKAIENYQKAADLNPYLWQSRQNIAAIYFERGEYQKALDKVLEALKINPNFPQLYTNLGIVYLKIGDKEKAKQAFQTALTLDPNNQLARMGALESSK